MCTRLGLSRSRLQVSVLSRGSFLGRRRRSSGASVMWLWPDLGAELGRQLCLCLWGNRAGRTWCWACCTLPLWCAFVLFSDLALPLPGNCLWFVVGFNHALGFQEQLLDVSGVRYATDAGILILNSNQWHGHNQINCHKNKIVLSFRQMWSDWKLVNVGYFVFVKLKGN